LNAMKASSLLFLIICLLSMRGAIIKNEDGRSQRMKKIVCVCVCDI
jgi:hypothetical protein